MAEDKTITLTLKFGDKKTLKIKATLKFIRPKTLMKICRF